jgi:hypothetical protein
MASLFNGTDLLGAFIKAFNIEGTHIRSLDIHVEVDDIVTVKVTHYMDVEQEHKLVQAFEYYTLTPDNGKDKKNENT